MCIAAIAWQCSADRPLVLAANRDEYYSRPAAKAAFWPGTDILAGMDLAIDEPSTWLGITRRGRFALLTNVRKPSEARPDAPSRGSLVARFLAGTSTPEHYLNQLQEKYGRYNGFNLLLGTLANTQQTAECWFLHSKDQTARRLLPGVYGLSNASLDTPWPKVQRLVGAFTIELMKRPASTHLLALLQNTLQASPEILPQTGVSAQWERVLSSIFIKTERYGTRASTLIDIRGNSVNFIERCWSPSANDVAHSTAFFEDSAFTFNLTTAFHPHQPA